MMNLASVDISGSNFKYDLKLRKPNFSIMADIDIKYVDALDLKFNDTSAVSTINLRIPKYKNLRGSLVENKLYDLIVTSNRPLITLNDSICFYIDDIDEVQKSDIDCVKTVTCYSREKMLTQRNIFLNDMEVLHIAKNEVDIADGALDMIHKELPSWSIGYLDPNATKEIIDGGLSEKYRAMNGGQKIVYDWLKNDCTLAFKCLFLFDSYNKKIDTYNEASIGKLIPLELSLDNHIKNVTKKTKGSQIITRLYVDGGQNQKSTDNANGVDISEANPTGKSYIEDFTPYLDAMSDELKTALTTYNSIVEAKNLEFLQLKIDINNINSQILTVNNDLTTLREALQSQASLKIRYIKDGNNADLTTVTIEINRLNGLITTNDNTLTNLNTQLDLKNSEIADIATYLEKATCRDGNNNLIFTNELLCELDDYIVESTFSTDSILTSTGLYNRAKEELTDIQQGIIEFDIELQNFIDSIKVPNGDTWDKVLTLGDYFMIDTAFGKRKLRLISLNHTPKKGNNASSFKLTFSNKATKFSEFKLGDSINKGVSASGTLNKNVKKWNDFKWGVDFSKDIMQNGLNLATAMVNGRSATNKVNFDEYGLFVIDSTNESYQLYVGSSIIAMTEDGWLTTETAMTREGIIGGSIIGELICGQRLYIKTENNEVMINGDGITISDANNINLSTNSSFSNLSGTVSSHSSSIQLLQNQIALTVTADGVRSIIQQNPDSVKIGFNGIDNNIQFTANGLEINFGKFVLRNNGNTVVIDGQHNMHKIMTEGTTQINYTGSPVTITINHGLGYKPIMEAFQMGANGTNEFTVLPAITWDATYGATACIRCRCDATNIYFDFLKTSNYTGGNLTVFIKYLLMKEMAF